MENNNLFTEQEINDMKTTILDENNNNQIFKKRFKEYNPSQSMFMTLYPDELFPHDSFERFIIDMFNTIDLSSFIKSNKMDLGGNSEYNPKMMLIIIFYAATNGIYHYRKIDKLCKYDQRYFLLSSEQLPDYSTFSRFIKKYSDEIVNIFSKILFICQEKGFINNKLFAMDGTKIKAHAASKFTGKIKDFKKRKTTLEKNIKLALEKFQDSDSSEELKNYWSKKKEKYDKDLEKINNFLKTVEKQETLRGDEIQQNTNDPDCRIMKDHGSFTEAYNAQAVACGETGIIVSNDVTNNAADVSNFKTNYENTKEILSEEEIKDSKFLGDAGYHSAENMEYSKKNNIDVYIPQKKDKNVYRGEKKVDLLKKGRITSEDLDIKIEDEKYVLTCPGKEILSMKEKPFKNRESSYYLFYMKDKSKCEKCSYFSICYGKTKNKTFSIRQKVIDNIDYILNTKNKLYSDEGRMIYSNRMPLIEKVFAHIKYNLGFNRFTRVGMNAVKTQWSIMCSAYNLRRMYNLSI